VILLGLAACGTSSAEPTEDERAHVRDQMAGHHADAVAIRDAIVAGDMAEVKAGAKRLRDRLPMQDLPAGTATPERAFVDRLLKLEAARDTAMAGEALGGLVGACAACHQAVGATPEVPAAPEPAGGDTLAASMAAHRHAANEMWAGLVIPAPERVKRGAEVLSTAVLTPTGTPVGSPLSPLATELEVRVHDLAASAARTDDPAQRASAWGRMLGTCAACHAVTHGGPQSGE
jgi:cytochrome c553